MEKESIPVNHIDFSQEVLDYDGKPVFYEPDKVLTLKIAIRSALSGNYDDDRQVSGEKKFARGDLSSRVTFARVGETKKFKAEEISMMKEYVLKAWPITISYFVNTVLDA